MCAQYTGLFLNGGQKHKITPEALIARKGRQIYHTDVWGCVQASLLSLIMLL